MNIAKKLLVIALLVLTTFSAAGAVYAQESPTGQPSMLRGKITAVSNSGFSLNTPAGDDVTVNVTAETRIRLAETRSEGSLSDIEVGNFAGVRGQPGDDGSVTARSVLVLVNDPRDLDRLRGKVTAIEGNTLVVANRAGEQQRIITDENTRIRIGKQPGSLQDISPDDPVLALGNLQSDGSLQARLVNVITAQQIRQHTLRGEVVSVDVAAGELTLEATGQKEGRWTVTTTDQTQYRIRDIQNPALTDIEAGDQVMIVGRAAARKNSGVAWFIAVMP